MQKSHSSKDLARLVWRRVFRQRGLKGGTAHTTDGGHGAAEYEQWTFTDKGIAHVPEEIEEDGGADDAEVDVVGARVLGLGADDFRAAKEAGDQGKDHEKGDDTAGVYDGDKDRSFEGVPAEHELAVKQDDRHGAHCYAEHGRVNGGDEGQVSAYSGVGTWASGPKDGDWCQDVVGFDHLGQPGEPSLAGAFGNPDVLSLLSRGQLAFFGE